MKRGMVGGAHRGPVAPSRQRRTIRFVSGVAGALSRRGLMMLAGYSPCSGSSVSHRLAVLMILGGIAIGAAGLLSDGPSVRIPTPARLDELAGRAEAVAIEKAAD